MALRSVPRARRAAALGLAVALLGTAACSDDDEEGFPAAVAEEAGDDEAAEAGPGEGVCGLLPASVLEAAASQAFRPGEPSEGTCTYRGEDGRATVTVNVTDLPADAELALETTSSTCDAGTAGPLEDVGPATGAFACTVSGVRVAAGTSPTTYAVVMGAGLPDDTAADVLATVLAEVLTAAET